MSISIMKCFMRSSIFIVMLFSKPCYAVNSKKGVGWSESAGRSVSVLNSLNVSWFYSWGATTTVTNSTASFVPMAYSNNSISKLPNSYSAIILGFNEPDNANQSNMTVAEAVKAWPTLRAKARMLGSPAMSGNPLNTGSWLEQFMSQMGNQTDFVTLHWYKGTSASTFKSDVQALCNKFNKSVWVTEFAPQTVSSAQATPNKYTQASVVSFMTDVTAWMTNNSCVSGFAWHDSKYGTSSLYSSNSLSATGQAYAAIK